MTPRTAASDRDWDDWLHAYDEPRPPSSTAEFCAWCAHRAETTHDGRPACADCADEMAAHEGDSRQ